MTSMERAYNVTTLTDGTFIGINVGATNTAYVYSNFTAPTGVGGAGSVFDYQALSTQALDAAASIVGAIAATTGARAIVAGDLFRDMGDRYTFSANGYATVMLAGVQPLTNASYEGAENKMYTAIWAAAPSASNVTTVGVARL